MENDLERYLLKRPQQVHASNIDHIKQQYKRWAPETMRKKKPTEQKGNSGSLNQGAIPEGGRR
jgi:hypothetical protein